MAVGSILIKLGGGLLTDKTRLCTVDDEAILRCAEAIRSIHDSGVEVTLVHGAGGFGHLRAREHRLAEGRIEGLDGQEDAIKRVREEMLQLNGILCAALIGNGVPVQSIPAHTWARGTGMDFHGQMEMAEGLVSVTFGDVVTVEGEMEFGILSGDYIMTRLARQLDPDLAVFLLDGVDGLLSAPPGDPSAVLLQEWSRGEGFTGHHHSEMDVTGGIGLKTDCAATIAATGIDTWFLDGHRLDRLLELVDSGVSIGTRILA